ncbi:MAG: zinc-ribbon domain-containing protein [Rhodospirillales bacterium]|nr:zinc-ribbon domain-containing protein [Rhodospirillales bacterium]
MILSCPKCAARFAVDPAALGPGGRQVRCGRCRNEWFAAAPVEAEIVAEPVPRSEMPIRTRLVGVLAGALVARDAIMAEYSWSRPVYAALGFEAPGPGDGLKLLELKSSRAVEDGMPVLTIEGKIANISDLPRVVPTLRGALRDDKNRELQNWTFTVPNPRLAPGESVAFKTEVRQPANAATDLSITFIASE